MTHKNFRGREYWRRSNQAAFLIFLVAVGTLLPCLAHAKSAMAIGLPDDVAAKGVAFGAGYNYGTREEAEARAMAECKNQNAPDATPLCKIVAHFDNECVAVSLDPKDGTPGFGWAIAATSQKADDETLANCRQTAGPSRVGIVRYR